MRSRHRTGMAVAMAVVVLTVFSLSWGKQTLAASEPEKALLVDLGGGVKMEFVLIPPGSFMMGSEKGVDAEKPVHKVTITKPFYLGKCEVTQEQWQAVLGTNPAHFKGAKNPVETVSWEDCQTFLRKLSEKLPGRGFRLPTEAEWEYACRAGSTTEFCYGEDAGGLAEYAWFGGNSDQTTHAVGQKKPNAWGLFDMHGNVWEWCGDWYEGYAGGAQTDPKGPADGNVRLLRGGAWNNNPQLCSSVVRDRYSPVPTHNIGLRAASALEQ